MQPTEIRDKLMTGEISPDQAREMFEASRAKPTRKTYHPAPMKPQVNQMSSRQELASFSPSMNRGLVQVDAQNFYTRMMIEEKARHLVGIPAYAIIGVIDGILDAAGYGLSEIVEDLSFGVTRTIYRFKDGIQRGKS